MSSPPEKKRPILYEVASSTQRALDHAATQAAVTVVEHCELSRRHRALRLGEAHGDGAVCAQRGLARLVGLPIAHLDAGFEFRSAGLHQPVAGARRQRTAGEQRMIVA